MTTIFDILKSILFSKKKDVFSNFEDENVFSPYMTTRWVSMYSPRLITECNILNRYSRIFVEKQNCFNFFFSILPAVASKKINYIKKTKEDKAKEIPNLKLISESMELSQREIKKYLEE